MGTRVRLREFRRWFCLVLFVGGGLLPARAEAQDTVQQWRRWEKTIVSSRDFTLSGGNPYRDLIVRVRFTLRNSTKTFDQDAYWEDLAGAPKSFKVRSAFPPGTWDWQVVGCTGTTGGQNCAVSTTWAPSSGYVTVTTTGSPVQLYSRGFVSQNALLTKSVPPQYISFSELRYGDAVTPFFWAGDTAWPAPPREIGNQTAVWATYLSDRRAKGFSAILVAPAVSWSITPSLPPAAGFSFIQSTGCTGVPIPNDCSKPASSYWQAFDELIKLANDQDLLVVVVSMVDPIGAESLNNKKFPNESNAKTFSRYLAARLAGSHVAYSPGFDTLVSRTTHAGTSMGVVMDAVGRILKVAAPRHLVSNHLGGSSTCPDYKTFADPLAPWMTFYLFQSGHAGGLGGTAGPACPARLSGETALTAAMRRAREMPLTLRAYAGPAMPTVNGEGPYDANLVSPHEVDNRYRVRQAGHLSSLSDALGFTYGAYPQVYWNQPQQNLNLDSAKDMTVLANRFRGRAGMPARHGWILNQQTVQEKKMVLASNDSSVVLAYVPGSGAAEIKISTSALPSLSCGTEWTRKWYPANSSEPLTGSVACTQTTGQITVARPACGSNIDCDWFLEMTRTGAALSGPSSSLEAQEVEVWAEPGSEAGVSTIRFGARDSGLGQPPNRATVSEVTGAQQASPRIARLGQDYLVVWEADGVDGSLLGLFARRVDRRGRLVGRQVQVNQTTEHDQSQPAVASDALGNTVVVWTSYGQDGDLGGIVVRRIDGSLSFRGDEVAVNQDSVGHQSRPQVAFDAAGRFVVAWETERGEEAAGRISYRRFSPAGSPITPEIEIAVEEDAAVRLVDLVVDPLGNVAIRWAVLDFSGEMLGVVRQRFDESGRPLSGPEQVFP